jgi:hypothetical protein
VPEATNLSFYDMLNQYVSVSAVAIDLARECPGAAIVHRRRSRDCVVDRPGVVLPGSKAQPQRGSRWL